MNIYHLKYFIDAARLQSVSESAAKNFVSHSTVSQAIKGLEAHLEVSLLFHSKRNFQLTPEGEMCLLEGEKMLAQLDGLKETLQANRHEVKGHLTLWAPQSLLVDSLYKTLEIYQKKYPKVQIQIKTGVAAQVRSAIQNDEGHIGLLVDDGQTETFNSTVVRKGHFVLVSRPKNIVTGEVIVTSRGKIEVQHLLKNYKARFKKELGLKMEVMSWGVIKNLVEKGFGTGYVPDYCVTQELASGKLVQVEIPRAPFAYEVRAIWAAHKRLNPNADLFVGLLKEKSQT